MSVSWVRCCFERGRLKRGHKSKREMDERFGDASISGPMEGGWNQASSTVSPKEHNSEKLSISDRQTSDYTSSKRSSPQEKDYEVSPSEKQPDFVYKPASQDFFKNMADIGRSRNSSPAPRPLQHRHAASLEPVHIAGGIPCHPSYQRNMPRGPSPAPRSSSSNRESRSTVSPRCVSPQSIRPRRDTDEREDRDRENYYDRDQEYTAPPPRHTSSFSPPLGSVTNPKPKTKKAKRVVTQEMVPSETELFG